MDGYKAQTNKTCKGFMARCTSQKSASCLQALTALAETQSELTLNGYHGFADVLHSRYTTYGMRAEDKSN